MTPRFSSILVANRGEIALRVMRTAKDLGYRTVAVYSDADAAAPHVRFADKVVRIGPGPVGESYLDPARILEAARVSGAEAVHPGYGFLSENAGFAEACMSQGLVFIGPTPDAIAAMGDKARAKRRMIDAGVPCVPGYEGEDQSDAAFAAAAADIGFPIMVKAAAGGGGRGMRLVHDKEALPDALAMARTEAASAFGSDVLILERAIERPRHVEIQVMADALGRIVHLGERDCSVQRRHQKVIEEAPCPVMTPELRARMGAAACDAARAVDYRGAGTVEFLLDESGAFFFLEMNTRLQVEHPVTEVITGQDLVALQILVAQGDPLPFAQDEVRLDGHAIEVRLYAEDPARDFAPATGRVRRWSPPARAGVRVDDGIASGFEISPFYDPMIAKIISHGPDRETARRRLVAALEEAAFLGPATNRGFLAACLEADAFVSGGATTAFIGETFGPQGYQDVAPDDSEAAVAAVLLHELAWRRAQHAASGVSPVLKNWANAHSVGSRRRFRLGDADVDIAVRPQAADRYVVAWADRTFSVVIEAVDAGAARLSVDGARRDVAYELDGEGRILIAGARRTSTFEDLSVRPPADAAGEGRILAPMHGLVTAVNVAVGDHVTRGQKLAVLEAMKMQHDIRADVDGVVAETPARAGVQMAADAVLVVLTPDKEVS